MASVRSTFADLPDPRNGNARRHNLLDILTIALIASICGAESRVDFADFARSLLASNAIACAYLTQPLLFRPESPT